MWCALDELQFRRVLDNLLSNALRHNRLGTVLFFDLTAGGGRATLCIADNGVGIPPERARDIFEPFVVGSDARSGPGSGLGLSITRRIVEKHGGTDRSLLLSRPGTQHGICAAAASGSAGQIRGFFHTSFPYEKVPPRIERGGTFLRFLCKS